MRVGDHIRVVGRWVIDHHRRIATPDDVHSARTVEVRSRGLLKIGPAHAELHPIRWNDIQLVDPRFHTTMETLSLAAPLHEEVYLGAGSTSLTS